jgi:hypothetical protein
MRGQAMRLPAWIKTRWTLKKILLVAVILVVAVALGRTLVFGGVGKGAVDVTGEGEVKTEEQRAPRTLDAEGGKIRAEGGPVAVLNPGLARPGADIGVNASGFDPGAAVDVLLSSGNDKPAKVASAKADREGNIDTKFRVPAEANAGGTQTVTVRQANSDKAAKAELIAQAGVGTARLSDDSAAPGNTLTVDAEGFQSGEKINVYWAGIGGKPSATLEADKEGRLSRAQVTVGPGPAGTSSVILVGEKSKTTAVQPFQLLALYPSAATNPYAVKAGEAVGISGKGFAPNEKVLVYFDQASGTPPITMQAANGGSVGGESFKVPFGLKGQHSLILTGEQSRASVKTGFSVLPYSPVARPGTYGGLPGTTLNFYVTDFAPNEAVHVYTGKGGNSKGELVAAFRVDDKGRATAAGSYVLPADVSGKLTFTLVGARSEGTASATATVEKPNGPVNLSPQPKYSLPPDLKE